MAKRKVITPSRTTVRFRVPSPKNDGRSIECESTLEHDLVLLAEFSRNVVRMEEQKEMRIELDDDAFTAHIDFEFVLGSGELEYHEVKYVDEANQPEVAQRLGKIRAHLAEQGLPYYVDMEDTIRRHDYLISNLLALRRYKVGDKKYAASLKQRVPQKLTTVKQLVRDVGNNTDAIAMIAWQHIYCDYMVPLNDDTPLRAIKEGDYAFLYR